ncbi:hypothetical protein MMC20_006708 [Loxospora ochrophaea]|nr:hypothetical protein [Loxospora ochrophaea]
MSSSTLGPSGCCTLASYVDAGERVHEQLRRQVGQTLIASAGDLALVDGVVASSESRRLVEHHYLGSFVLSASNLQELHQASALIRALHYLARSAGQSHPLLLAVEHERGSVNAATYGLQTTQQPCPSALAAGQSLYTTSSIGEAIGKELSAIGINWAISPSAETITDLTEPLDVSTRFGNKTEIACDHAVAFAEGLHAGGAVTCATDALTSAIQQVYYYSLEKDSFDISIEDVEVTGLFHLRQLLQRQAVDFVMLSSSIHNFDHIDRASFAIRFVIDTVLRRHLNFHGPVIADCSMVSLENKTCRVHAPLYALLLGCDMVRLPNDSTTRQAGINAIYAALTDNKLSSAAIAASAIRVSTLKQRCLSFSQALHPPSPTLLPSLLPAHASLAKAAYRASIKSLQQTSSPLGTLPSSSVLLLLTPSVHPLSPTSHSDPFEPLGRFLTRSHPRIRHVPYTLSKGLTSTHLAFLQRVDAVVLVFANTSSVLAEAQEEVWDNVENVLRTMENQGDGKTSIPRVVVGAGDVRDLKNSRRDIAPWWGVHCWDYSPGALEAAAEVMVGEREVDMLER